MAEDEQSADAFGGLGLMCLYSEGLWASKTLSIWEDKRVKATETEIYLD